MIESIQSLNPWELIFLGVSLLGLLLLFFLSPVLLGHEKIQLWFCIPKPGEAIPLSASGTGRITNFAYEPDGDFHLNNPHDQFNFDHAARPWERLPNQWERTGSNGVKQPWTWRDKRNFLTRKTGYYFFLFPWTKVHEYKFSWSELTQPEAKGDVKFVAVSRVEDVRSIFLKDVLYYGEATNVPDVGNVPLRVKYSYTLRTTNPFVSLTLNDEFLLRVVSKLEEAVRFYCGQKGFEELKSEKDDPGEKKIYADFVQGLNPVVIREIGQMVVDINIMEIDLMNDSDDSAKALRAVTNAKHNAQAAIEKAKGEATALDTYRGKEIELLNRELEVQTRTPERVAISKIEELAKSRIQVIGGTPLLGINLTDDKTEGTTK